MNKLKIILLIGFLYAIIATEAFPQKTGEPLPGFNPDTIFVFDSPRPLVNNIPPEARQGNQAGLSMIMSGSGYGVGFFYLRKMSDYLSFYSGFFLSGARRSDEIEIWDDTTNQAIVPGKIHRLYLVPIMFGAEYQPFAKIFDNSLIPYVRLGAGPSFIFANSYQVEYFKALGQMDTYVRFGAYLGIGANMMAQGKSAMGIDISYYYIPFGGNGIESVIGLPIRDFGGMVLSLTFAFKF